MQYIEMEFPRSYEEAEEWIGDNPRNEWGRESIDINYHPITVTLPETKSIGLHKYTTYLVAGKTHSNIEFSVRKRYNDFDWIQKTLQFCFPGVFTPPIPKKKQVGRFDAMFIENRRYMLEEFLLRIFNRKYLYKSNLFTSWLISNECGIDQLKKSYEKPSYILLLEEYKDNMEYLVNNKYTSTSIRVDYFRSYLAVHYTTLKKLNKIYLLLCGTYGTNMKIINEMYEQFNIINSNEYNASVNENLFPSDMCRLPFNNILFNKLNSFKYLSYGHNEVMSSVFARELDDTESMIEAVRQYDRLSTHVCNLKESLSDATLSLEKLQSGNSGGVLTYLHIKSYKEIIELKVDEVTRLKDELAVCEEWAAIVRNILLNKEIPEFTAQKVHAYDDGILIQSYRFQHSIHYESTMWSKYLAASLTSLQQKGRIPPQLTLGSFLDSGSGQGQGGDGGEGGEGGEGGDECVSHDVNVTHPKDNAFMNIKHNKPVKDVPVKDVPVKGSVGVRGSVSGSVGVTAPVRGSVSGSVGVTAPVRGSVSGSVGVKGSVPVKVSVPVKGVKNVPANVGSKENVGGSVGVNNTVAVNGSVGVEVKDAYVEDSVAVEDVHVPVEDNVYDVHDNVDVQDDNVDVQDDNAHGEGVNVPVSVNVKEESFKDNVPVEHVPVEGVQSSPVVEDRSPVVEDSAHVEDVNVSVQDVNDDVDVSGEGNVDGSVSKDKVNKKKKKKNK
eukprot:GHVR01090800.1.p1 GENE.GHVR01090800.1~~GHVR01090800.1.p1  ORF type:complete len:721 (-),score=237.61 GHVR01090800.1:236-2398(-)